MIRQKLAKTFKITMCSGHFAVFPALENLSCQDVRGLVNRKYIRFIDVSDQLGPSSEGNSNEVSKLC